VAHELTKMHEELLAGTLQSLGVYYGEHPPRGEVTLVMAGSRNAPEDARDPAALVNDAHVRARDLLAAGESRRDVAVRLARELGISRNEAYRVVTAL
jgi:16S rRNA (cytidine1402-2'-O)-methyltransferase